MTPVLARSELRLRDLVKRYAPLVARRLRRLGVPSSALDDAAQRVFWVASRKLERIESGVEGAFLLTTATRVASDVRRVEARRTRREVALDEETEAVTRLDELLDLKRAHTMLERLLTQMPAELAAVFVMSEAEGLSATEVSRIVGVPVGTVASRLRRARCFVQQRVRRARSPSAPVPVLESPREPRSRDHLALYPDQPFVGARAAGVARPSLRQGS